MKRVTSRSFIQRVIRSTSDIGDLVYNLIASGDLEKTPKDSRADFDNVYDFETDMRQNYVMMLDDVLT